MHLADLALVVQKIDNPSILAGSLIKEKKKKIARFNNRYCCTYWTIKIALRHILRFCASLRPGPCCSKDRWPYIHSINLYQVESVIIDYPLGSALQRLCNQRLYFIFIHCLHHPTDWHRLSVCLLQVATDYCIFFPSVVLLLLPVYSKNKHIKQTFSIRACLHEGGGPQVGEVTCGGLPHLSCKRDQIKMRDYMDRRVTSPTWGPPPPCKQALRLKSLTSECAYHCILGIL